MPSRVRTAALVLPALLLVAHATLFAGYLVDDAYIAFGYGRSLASGLGLVLQPGAPAVEGYTSFGWVVLVAAAQTVGLDPTHVLPAVGLACAVSTIVLVVRVARRWDGARAAGLGAGLALAASTGFAFYAVAGLETSAFALAVTVAGIALVERRAFAFGVASGIAFLFRPEAGLLGIVGVTVLTVATSGAERKRALGAALAGLAIFVAPLLALKLVVFGALLPNTFAAKPASLASGVEYALREVPLYGPLGVAAIVAARTNADRRARELAALFFVFVAATILEGGDWMVAGRLFVPWLALAALAADGTLREWVGDVARRVAPRRRALAALGVVLLAAYGADSALESVELHASVPHALHRNAIRGELATSLAASGVRSVALVDIGYTTWVAPEVRVVDLGGLTDATIAHAPGGHVDKHVDFTYLERRAPDVVVLTSSDATDAGARHPEDAYTFGVERRIAASDWLAAHYRLDRIVTADATYRMHVYARAR